MFVETPVLSHQHTRFAHSAPPLHHCALLSCFHVTQRHWAGFSERDHNDTEKEEHPVHFMAVFIYSHKMDRFWSERLNLSDQNYKHRDTLRWLATQVTQSGKGNVSAMTYAG